MCQPGEKLDPPEWTGSITGADFANRPHSEYRGLRVAPAPKYACVECKPEHVRSVYNRLWARGVEELAGLGLTVEQGLDRAIGYLSRGGSRAILFNGDPVCVFGEVDRMTWFQATEAFVDHYREITKRLKALGERGYIIYSQCVHPRTEAWFKRLGYKRDHWTGTTVTGKPLYRFVKE